MPPLRGSETIILHTNPGPGGLVCDTDGNLYVAERAESRPGIAVYSPAGKELAFIKTELPTNVGFGRGKESKTLTSPRARASIRPG